MPDGTLVVTLCSTDTHRASEPMPKACCQLLVVARLGSLRREAMCWFALRPRILCGLCIHHPV